MRASLPRPSPARAVRARLSHRLTLSIRWQMTLLYTALLAVVLAVFSLFLVRSADSLMIASVTQTLHARFTQAMAAGPQIATALARHRTRSPAPLARPYDLPLLDRLAGPDLFLQVRDRAGRVVAVSANLDGEPLSLPLPRPSLGRPEATSDDSGAGPDDIIRLPVAHLLPEAEASDLKTARFALRSGPLMDAHGRVVGMLQVAQSLLAVDEVQDKLVAALARAALAALALAVAAGLWLAGRLVRPIAQMTAAARQIGGGSDLSRRIVVPTRRDEVGQLATTFNAMLTRLDRAFRAQQRFVSDAGHELKTPLTAILGQAHLIRRHGQDRPELVAEATTAIIEEAERLTRLTRDLLDLARLDEGQELAHDVVSLEQVTADVVTELTPLATERAIQVTVRGPATASTVVRGDADKLRQLVLNLVDNAITFTPAGEQVWVTVTRSGAGGHPVVVLEVQDSGRGIAPDDLPHIFERFYRADSARARASGGTGLGLAIVQDIARRHGGDVEVESRLGQGALFRVRLPAFAAEATATTDALA